MFLSIFGISSRQKAGDFSDTLCENWPMELLLPLFPVSVLSSIICVIFCAARHGRHPLAVEVCIFSLAFLLLTYAASLILVCANPYWVDGEVAEFIPWQDRWYWAALYASFLELILCPLWLMGYFLLRARHIRSAPTVGTHHD